MTKSKKFLSTVLALAMTASTMPMMWATVHGSETDPHLITEETFEGVGTDYISSMANSGAKWSTTYGRYGCNADTTRHAIVTANENTYLQLNDTSSSSHNDIGLKYTGNATDYPVSGKVKIKTDFMFPALANSTHYAPIAANNLEAQNNTTSYEYIGFVIAKVDSTGTATFQYAKNQPSSMTDSNGNATSSYYTTIDGITPVANKWYTLELTIDIDGDTTTFDSYSFTLTDGTNTATGTGPIGTRFTQYVRGGMWDLTELKRVYFGLLVNDAATEASPVSIAVDNISIKYDETNVTSTIDKTENVSKDATIELVFSNTVKAETLTNITVVGAESGAATVTPSTTDNLTVTLTPSSALAYGDTYTVTVPETVLDRNNLPVNTNTFTFTVEEESTDPDPEEPTDPDPEEPTNENVIFTETFEGVEPTYISSMKNNEDKWTVAYGTHGCNADTTRHAIVTANENTYLQLNDTSSGAHNDAMLKYTEPDKKTFSGTLKFKTDFMFPKLDSTAACYAPIAINNNSTYTSWNTCTSFVVAQYNKTTSAWEFKYAAYQPTSTDSTNGGRYDVISGVTPAANKWYTLELTVNVDGDSATFDTYSFKLSDSTGVLSDGLGGVCGTLYTMYSSAGDWDMTEIKNLLFGLVIDSSGAASIALDNISAERLTAPVYTANIENNATDVAVNQDIVLTFDKELLASSIGQIVVYEGDVEENNIIPTTKTIAEDNKTVTIKVDETYNNARTYTVVVNKNVLSADKVGANPVNLIFSTKAMPLGYDITEASVPTLTAGQSVTVSAKFTKNALAESAELPTMIAALYNSVGTMIGVAYKKATSTTDTLQATFKIESDAGEGLYVQFMAWNDFANMTAMATAWSSLN